MASVQLPGRLDYGAVRNIGAGVMAREKHRADLKYRESAEGRAVSAEERAASAEERAADQYEFDKGQREIKVNEDQRELLSGIMEDAAMSGDYEAAKAAYERDMSKFGAGLGFAQEILDAEFTQEEYDGTIERIHNKLNMEGWTATGTGKKEWYTFPDGSQKLVHMQEFTRNGEVKSVPASIDPETNLPREAGSYLDPDTQKEMAKAKAIGQAEGVADSLWTKTSAEMSAAAKAELIPMKRKIKSNLSLIDKIRNHPGREAATGFSSLNPEKYAPGTVHRDFLTMLAQVKGKVFLEAYESLKGGGPITDLEGQKAQEAYARLDAAQSEEAFMEALDDYEQAVLNGWEDLTEAARGSAEDYRALVERTIDEPIEGAPEEDNIDDLLAEYGDD